MKVFSRKRPAAALEADCGDLGMQIERGESNGSPGSSVISVDTVRAMISEAIKEMNLVSKEDLTAAFDETLAQARATMRIDHTRGVNPKASLELDKIGIRLEGEEGVRIIKEQKMLPVSNFLKENVPKDKKVSASWFSRKLKALKLQQCDRDGDKPYLQYHMGEHRIAYMEADRPLMEELLNEMLGAK
jgi:hypothetical protein